MPSTIFISPCITHVSKTTNSNEYKLTTTVLDIARRRLFIRSFLKLWFANKGLDIIKLGVILHHKKDEELDIPSLLNYTSILTNSVILLDLPNAPRNLIPNF